MSKLHPAESIALTVALAQVLRGERPDSNVATVCVLALARLESCKGQTAADEERLAAYARDMSPDPASDAAQVTP